MVDKINPLRDFEDFGFSAHDSVEFEQHVEIEKIVEVPDSVSSKRLNFLRQAIQPLLNSLKADPNKDYIYWPDRVKKIDDFTKKLDNIVEGGYDSQL